MKQNQFDAEIPLGEGEYYDVPYVPKPEVSACLECALKDKLILDLKRDLDESQRLVFKAYATTALLNQEINDLKEKNEALRASPSGIKDNILKRA